MEQNNVLVAGAEKTGTTVISKAIKHPLKSANFKEILTEFMEDMGYIDWYL